MKRTIAVLIAGAMAAAPLSGCSQLISSEKPARSCDWVSSGGPEGAGQTLLLLDRSYSTRAGIGPNYAVMLQGAVRAAVRTHDVVSIGTFDGSASSVRWQAERWATDRDHGKNSANQKADDDTATACLTRALERAAGTAAQLSGSDVVGALVTAGKMLRGTASRTIVIATDGLANVGCADLTHVSIGNISAIDQISGLCKERNTDQWDLSGINVELVGVGHPADRQKQPSTLQLNWMERLWLAVCRSTRATCVISDQPLNTVGQTVTGPPVSDPEVSFPTPDGGIQQADGSILFRLDALPLFTPNSWDLSSAGQATLDRIAGEIMASSRVEVHGYTEAQASEVDNRTLAQHRADAVKSYLDKRQVPNVTALGHAGNAPQCPPQARGAEADPQTRQCNRRVDIVAYG